MNFKMVCVYFLVPLFSGILVSCVYVTEPLTPIWGQAKTGHQTGCSFTNIQVSLIFFVYVEFLSIHIRLNTIECNFIVESNQQKQFRITLNSTRPMFFNVHDVVTSRYHSKFCLTQNKKRDFFRINLGCFEKWWPKLTKFVVKEDVKQ
ncbi:Hypothetical predicted protein [Octopus vulgaris]|uniref:Uncharacterized protein n=1 Tax=Octopus vulgaris TaxID=6645 RepID=A0AA36BC64_OCTVU|nr:Hypothetical predicted protein [Octopus vulgaris]